MVPVHPVLTITPDTPLPPTSAMTWLPMFVVTHSQRTVWVMSSTTAMWLPPPMLLYLTVMLLQSPPGQWLSDMPTRAMSKLQVNITLMSKCQLLQVHPD